MRLGHCCRGHQRQPGPSLHPHGTPTPTLNLAPADDSGVRNGDNSGADLTNSTTVHLTGTAQPGEQIMIGYGGPFGTNTIPVVTKPDGSFTVTLSNLPVIASTSITGPTPSAISAPVPSPAMRSPVPGAPTSTSPPPRRRPRRFNSLPPTTAGSGTATTPADLTMSATVHLTGTGTPNEKIEIGYGGPFGTASQSVVVGPNGTFTVTLTNLPTIANNQHYWVHAIGYVGALPGNSGSITSAWSSNVYFTVAPLPTYPNGTILRTPSGALDWLMAGRSIRSPALLTQLGLATNQIVNVSTTFWNGLPKGVKVAVGGPLFGGDLKFGVNTGTGTFDVTMMTPFLSQLFAQIPTDPHEHGL